VKDCCRVSSQRAVRAAEMADTAPLPRGYESVAGPLQKLETSGGIE